MVDQYEQRQRHYWDQLRQELQRYKTELGASHSELADGMGISRQPVVSFMQEKREDLPIYRAHLVRLWDHLTSPESYPKRGVSEARRTNRQALRNDGPSHLLKLAGFLPDEENLKLEVIPKRHQQIQRLVSGLSNIPVPDDADFVDLLAYLEREVISKAFGFKSLASTEQKKRLPYHHFSEQDIDQWADHWIKDNLYVKPTPEIEKRLKRAIAKLLRRGKYDLKDQEVFELFLSILDNSSIENKTKSHYKIRVSQCQFSTLTFSILDSDSSGDQAFRDELLRIFLCAEAKLRFPDSDGCPVLAPADKARYLNNSVSDMVTEALVTCIVRIHKPNDDQGDGDTQAEIRWSYGSSGTHFENMLTAIFKGMGCEEDLELVNFATTSLGQRSDSLVKSSTTFRSRSRQHVHQGVWVDSSIVVGTAQSVLVAVKSWLAHNLPNELAYRSYYDVCNITATIDNSLKHGCKVLSDYILNKHLQTLAAPAREHLEKEVIARIKDVQEEYLQSMPILQNWHGVNLSRKYCWAQIACARSSFVAGDLAQAAQFLENAEETLVIPGVAEDIPLTIRLDLEKMLQSFYGGDHRFITSRAWRKTLSAKVKALHTYIYEENPHSTHRHYCGRMDTDVYLCASEIFARAGRLEFTFATEVEVEYLEQAGENLLMAAYYASKVGERQRTAHWLANASRVYCRLGDGEKAAKLARIAERILKQAVDERYSPQYKEAIMAEVVPSTLPALLLQTFNSAIPTLPRSFSRFGPAVLYLRTLPPSQTTAI